MRRIEIEAALVSHLLADQRVTTIIGSNLFPLAIPLDKDVPAVVFQRISSPRTLSLGGSSANNPRIQFSCYAKTFSLAKEIATVVYESLDTFRGMLGGQVRAAVLMADSRDDYEPDTGRYRCDIDFFVMHHKQKGE